MADAPLTKMQIDSLDAAARILEQDLDNLDEHDLLLSSKMLAKIAKELPEELPIRGDLALRCIHILDLHHRRAAEREREALAKSFGVSGRPRKT